MSGPELLERDEHLARLEILLKQAAAGEGRVVLVEGEAGIGKTALARAADRLALDAGFTVLRARGAELERDFPHGVVRQLFEPLVHRSSEETRARVFRGAAALAAPVVGLTETTGAPPADASFAANHALYWLTVEISDLAPLCLVVDDLHWADRASLAFLDYLARRVHELPVLLVGLLRPAEPGSDQALLDDLRSVPSLERVDPGPLSRGATAALITAKDGVEPAADFADACHEVTRGNPFFVEELLRALPGRDPSAVRHLGPPAIARAVLGRLARMWPEALEVARVVAVLDVDATPGRVATVAGLDIGTTAEAADALVSAHVLSAGRTLRFLHPILRQAVYDDIPPLRRAHLHRVAADELERAGDPDRGATHLLSTTPAGDARVVETLRGAATRAVARGAPVAAARLLRRALEEPPRPDVRPRVLFEAGRAARLAGDAHALDLVQEALDTAGSLELIADSAEEFGLTMSVFGDLTCGVHALDDASERVKRDPELWLRLRASRLMISVWSDEIAEGARRELQELLPVTSPDTPTGRLVLADMLLHTIHDLRMPAAQMHALGVNLDVEGWVIEENTAAGPPWMGVVAGLWAGEDPAPVDAYLDRVFAHASSTGSRSELATYWHIRAFLHTIWGALAEAEECAERALQIAPAVGMFLGYSVGSNLALSMTCRGQSAQAERRLGELGLLRAPVAALSRGRSLLVARSHVHSCAGRQEEALSDAREAALRDRRFDRTFVQLSTFWSSALALHAAGAAEEAQDAARHELRVATRFGSPVVEGLALMVTGIVHGGDVEVLAEAVQGLDGSHRKYDLARALVEYGAALRRTNQRAAARDPLTRGMELAHRIGAEPLVQRARTELLATGARPRRLVVTGADALTASERRVATMAADGLSNTEIAQALFVTRKTVEKHLAGAFQKLAISARTELATALGAS